jgi:hypothetical protein
VITVQDLRKLARARLKDAEVLFESKRYDGVVYVVGYAVEYALKARIARTLGWKDFPSTGGEFEDLRSLRVHKLPVLLKLSGREQTVKAKHSDDWNAVAAWDPEARYRPIGGASRRDAELMVAAVKVILGDL